MDVICIEREAFYSLIELVIQRINEKNASKEDKWVSQKEAMQKLKIKSKTTMQKLRDEGKIRFSQPKKKILVYDIDSIYEYLEMNIKKRI